MTRGIICLEGPDASGKSTLAETLRVNHGAVVIHAGRRWLDKMWLYHNAILNRAIDLAFNQNRLVVLDRHWPSEQVYGSVFRNGGVKPRLGRLFDRMLRRFEAQYVMCLPSNPSEYLDHYRHDIDPDHPYDGVSISKVYWGYHQIWSGHGNIPSELHPLSYAYSLGCDKRPGVMHRGDWVRYDMFEHPDRGVQFCKDLVNELPGIRKERWWHQTKVKNLAGFPLNVKAVLVGDKLNPSKVTSRREPWPFYDHEASSYYLCEQLDLAGIPEQDICVINAEVPTKKGLYVEAMHEVNWFCNAQTPFVALGRAAADSLSFGAMRCVPHPSYARRFKVPGYHLILKQAIEG